LKRLTERKIRGVVFDLDNTLIQSKKGARQGLRIVASILAKRLRREGYYYTETNMFRRLRLIDLEMHGENFSTIEMFGGRPCSNSSACLS